LGTILYEMLTGGLPYRGENVYDVMRAKTSEDPQPPSRFRPDLAPSLEEIILHALERQPRNRYASAADLLTDLRDPAHVRPTGRAAVLHPRSLRKQQIRRVLWSALFFASLVAVFAFLVWLANRFPATPAPAGRAYRGQVK
ncbi:MAG: hypothetical protein ACREQE_00800, partial [Candidatus Binataceae bacterium]